MTKTCIPQNDHIDNIIQYIYCIVCTVMMLTDYKNRFTSVVDQIMLTNTDVFPNIFSKASIAVLEQYPTPTSIVKANKDVKRYEIDFEDETYVISISRHIIVPNSFNLTLNTYTSAICITIVLILSLILFFHTIL
jgi:hypothetical protein